MNGLRRWTRRRVLLGLALAGGVWGSALTPAAATPVKKDGVTVELVSEYTSAAPGETVALGLVITHLPTFHTYWRQPGIVGLAPMLEWTLPEGCAAGDVLWPEPELTTMAGYQVWGYERKICLVTPVTIPATLDPAHTRELTFTLKAVWMACGRTCHPGHAELSLTLPLRPADAPALAKTAAAPLIATTRSEQPVTSAAWKVAAACAEDGGFTLTLTPPAGRAVPADAYFFSYARLVDSNVPQRREAFADGAVRLHLALVEEPDAAPETLAGEVFSAAGWDEAGRHRLLKVAPQLPAAAAAE